MIRTLRQPIHQRFERPVLIPREFFEQEVFEPGIGDFVGFFFFGGGGGFGGAAAGGGGDLGGGEFGLSEEWGESVDVSMIRRIGEVTVRMSERVGDVQVGSRRWRVGSAPPKSSCTRRASSLSCQMTNPNPRAESACFIIQQILSSSS